METTIKFRCNLEEKNLLETLAQELRVSKSDYLRSLINNREKPELKPKTKEQENLLAKSLENNYQNLSRIGSNLNQIAHFLNLENLKALDIPNPAIDSLLVCNHLTKEDLEYLKSDLKEAISNITEIKGSIEEVFKKNIEGL